MSGDASSSSGNTRRCHATILFADVCSSTRLAEICDPESLAEILHRVRQTAERVVSAHHGVINQFYGDGVLAAFGFPVPHENDVLHATEAALELNDAIAALELSAYLPKSFDLRLHTGVHAGLIVVQDGDRLQGQYKLYGDALNTAARLADAARAGEVFASESTLRGVLPYFDVQKLAPLHLKGKGASLPAYRVLRRTDVQTRFEASICKGLTPFVGRIGELRELQQRYRQCGEGRLQAVKVTGDAGLGKTRLAEEFLRGLPASTRILRAGCDRDSRAVPLQPILQIAQQCLSVAPSDQPPAAESDDAIHTILSLSKRVGDEQLPSDQLAEAVATLLVQAADGAALVLFIDDWHWADDLSRQVLSEVIRVLQQAPILVVLATRFEELSDRTLGATGFRLDPFSVSESRQAVSSLFATAVQIGIADSIHQRAGGNALFVEELCQTLRAEAADDAVVDSALSDVPATLHGLIESRLDRLAPEPEELVRTAAVIGATVPVWLIEQVIGYRLSPDLILELTHLDLLYLSDDRQQLQFKHGLTRDVIYESVPLRDRQSLHQRVAAILQQQADEAGDDDYCEALAYHYIGAGEDQQAMRYAERAGDKALAARALDRARQQYQSALEAMDRLECAQQNYAHWNALAQRYGWTCVFDPLPEQIGPLQRALELSEQHGDDKGRAKSEYWLGYINYALGRSAEAVHHCQQSLDGARATGETGLEIHALSTLAQSWASGGNYERALALFDEVFALRGRHPQGQAGSAGSAYATACRALILADRGQFQQAQHDLGLALQAVAGVDAEMEGSVWAVRTAAWIWQGRWQEALESANHAQDCARKITSTYVLGMGAALAGFVRWRRDGDRTHLDDLVEATNWLEKKSKVLFISLNYGLLAEALLEIGDYAGVRRYAARALVRARSGDRLGEAKAYRALAQLTRRQHRYRMHAPDVYLDRALASAQVRGSRRERAVTLLCRTMLHEQPDRQVTASLLRELRAEFAGMEMDWHAHCCDSVGQ